MKRSFKLWARSIIFGILGILTAVSCDAIEKEKEPSEEVSVTPQDEKSSAEQPGTDQVCKEDLCNGGFKLHILPTKGIYPAGEYSLTVTVEDVEYSFVCQISDTSESNCEPENENDEFDVDVDYDDYIEGKEDSWRGFIIRALDHEKPPPSIRGPETISIAITGENSFMANEDFTPEYRHLEPWGGPECGFCDVMEAPLIMKVTLPEESL